MNFQPSPNPPSCVLLDFNGTMYSYDEVYVPVWRRFFDDQGDAFNGADFQAVYDWVNTLFNSIPSGISSSEQHEFVFRRIKQLWSAVSGPTEQLISNYRQQSL